MREDRRTGGREGEGKAQRRQGRMRARDGRRGQRGRLSGEEGSGAAAANARRLPTPAAASAPPGADRCPRRSISLPCQAPKSRIPASPTLGSPRGRLRALHGAGAGRRARLAVPALPQFFAASGSAGAGSPLPWAPRRPLAPGGGGRQGHGRARPSRPGAGTARRRSRASPPPSLPNEARPLFPPLNAPTPPAPVPLQSPARSRSTHPLPQPHCADPAPPSLPHLHRLLRAARPRSLRSPGKDGRGQRCSWCRWPGLRLRGEAGAMAQRLRQGATVASPCAPPPSPPTPPLAVFKTAPVIITAMKTKPPVSLKEIKTPT